MNKTYERPMLKNVSLRNEEAVANTCWGHHCGTTAEEQANGQVLYTDLKGDGWASFKIGGGSCTLNLIQVRYHSGKERECWGNDGLHDINCPGVADATADQIAELTATLKAAGGESGNPYKGEGSVTIIPDPEKPIPSSW